jgi:hypothetical protein
VAQHTTGDEVEVDKSMLNFRVSFHLLIQRLGGAR